MAELMDEEQETQRLLNALYNRVRQLEKQVEELQNNQSPTVPIYDNTNWPVDAVEGQMVIAPI